jgi:hypothetical protein
MAYHSNGKSYDIQTAVGMSNFPHKTPFPLKIFGDLVFRRKDLFDGDIDPKVSSFEV